MPDSDNSRSGRWLRAIRTGGLSERKAVPSLHGEQMFRLGYVTALEDIERTGLQPMTDATRRRSAEAALRRFK